MPCLLHLKLEKLPRNTRRLLTSYIDLKPYAITVLFLPTIWRRSAMTIDTVKIIRSPHPMYTTNKPIYGNTVGQCLLTQDV